MTDTDARIQRRRAIAAEARAELEALAALRDPENSPPARRKIVKWRRRSPALPGTDLATTSATAAPVDRTSLEPGYPSLVQGVPTYRTDQRGIVARPSHATREVNEAIDAALDYNPDASHGAWIAKRLGLDTWTFRAVVPGTDEVDEAATDEALAFFERILPAYGGGIDAALEIGLDSLLRRGAIAGEFDVSDGRDDFLDFDFNDPTVIDFRVVRTGNHRTIVPVYQAQSQDAPVQLNPLTTCYLGINKRFGLPHGSSPFLPVVDTVFAQAQFRKTIGKVAANHGWARILLSLDYDKVAIAAGPDIVKRLDGGGYEVLDPIRFNEYMNTAREGLADKAKSMYPDDVWTLFNAVTPSSIGANHGQQSLRIGDVSQLLDIDHIVALHGQPTIWGRNYGAALSTTGDVQWIVYALGLEALRRYPARVVEWMADAWFRIRGINAEARLTFEDIRKEDRKAEAEAGKVEAETAIMLRDAGFIDDDEAAQMTVGHDATGGGIAPPAPPATGAAAPIEWDHAVPEPRYLPDLPGITGVPVNGNGHVHKAELAVEPFIPASSDVAGELELTSVLDLDDEDADRVVGQWRAFTAAEDLDEWAGLLEAVEAREAE